jgi:hypothetical protein
VFILALNQDLISKIADKNVDVEKFGQMIIDDPELRNETVYLMLNHPKIMVYYHSYYIIEKASEMSPELFYNYWDDFAPLLSHENSYHRDFGLTLIANLTEVDKENKFAFIFHDYFKRINDTKFMTARHCIQNAAKIMANKEEFKEDILKILLNIDNLCDFTTKQCALLKSNVIEIFDEFYEKTENKEKINEFIRNQLDSISPKTKKLAKEFVLKQDI